MPTTAPIPRPLLHGVVVVLVVAFALISTPAGAAQAERCPGALDVPASPETLDEAGDAVVCLVNIERVRRGLPTLRRDRDLAQAARRHAADMVRRAFFAHVSPGGTRLSDRLRASGYLPAGGSWRVGEALGWGTGARATPDALVDAWLGSPRHRRLLLEETYRELGLGVATGVPREANSTLPGATYTLDFGVIRSG